MSRLSVILPAVAITETLNEKIEFRVRQLGIRKIDFYRLALALAADSGFTIGESPTQLENEVKNETQTTS